MLSEEVIIKRWVRPERTDIGVPLDDLTAYYLYVNQRVEGCAWKSRMGMSLKAESR